MPRPLVFEHPYVLLPKNVSDYKMVGKIFKTYWPAKRHCLPAVLVGASNILKLTRIACSCRLPSLSISPCYAYAILRSIAKNDTQAIDYSTRSCALAANPPPLYQSSGSQRHRHRAAHRNSEHTRLNNIPQQFLGPLHRKVSVLQGASREAPTQIHFRQSGVLQYAFLYDRTTDCLTQSPRLSCWPGQQHWSRYYDFSMTCGNLGSSQKAGRMLQSSRPQTRKRPNFPQELPTYCFNQLRM